jgi:hypothetical protein
MAGPERDRALTLGLRGPTSSSTPFIERFDMAPRAGSSVGGDPDEVICFGVFDGTAETLRAASAAAGYEEQLARIAPYVRSVGADGVYDVVEDLVAEPRTST